MNSPPSSQAPFVPAASSLIEELKLVPSWSIALSALAFLFMQYLYWVVFPRYRHHPSTIPFEVRIYLALSWSALAALYFLMVGYVSQDSPRRNMNTLAWTLICLVMPGGIGCVLYFILRQPLVTLCPSCGASILGDFHFCPQCAHQVAASCGNCYRGVRGTDQYCVYCGHDLATDNTPARLRAFPS